MVPQAIRTTRWTVGTRTFKRSVIGVICSLTCLYTLRTRGRPGRPKKRPRGLPAARLGCCDVPLSALQRHGAHERSHDLPRGHTVLVELPGLPLPHRDRLL